MLERKIIIALYKALGGVRKNGGKSTDRVCCRRIATVIVILSTSGTLAEVCAVNLDFVCNTIVTIFIRISTSFKATLNGN